MRPDKSRKPAWAAQAVVCRSGAALTKTVARAAEVQFAAFRESLMPFLQRIGVPVSKPMFIPFYNEIEG